MMKHMTAMHCMKVINDTFVKVVASTESHIHAQIEIKVSDYMCVDVCNISISSSSKRPQRSTKKPTITIKIK